MGQEWPSSAAKHGVGESERLTALDTTMVQQYSRRRAQSRLRSVSSTYVAIVKDRSEKSASGPFQPV